MHNAGMEFPEQTGMGDAIPLETISHDDFLDNRDRRIGSPDPSPLGESGEGGASADGPGEATNG